MIIDVIRESEEKMEREIYTFDVSVDFYVNIILDSVCVQRRGNTRKKYKTIETYDRLVKKRDRGMEIEDLKNLVPKEKANDILNELENILNKKIKTNINNSIFFHDVTLY